MAAVAAAPEPLPPEERRRDPRLDGARVGGSTREFIAGFFRLGAAGA
ncbi:MAG: hypothetical protein OXI41_08405 [Chloroflexota bacterium]|nr:hypothetical protein [Chloroflexota bacterium]MDE2895026.1 hypothetical protein [Chloroflexota bacterium]